MQEIIHNISIRPITCVFCSVFFFLISSLVNYIILNALFKMHKGKSGCKKLRKEYNVWQRMRLLHFKNHCQHARIFCICMIVYHKISWYFLSAYLVLTHLYAFGFLSSIFIAYIVVGMFFLFILPPYFFHKLFSRPIIFGRHREYTFQKYHNTDNHKSLF